MRSAQRHIVVFMHPWAGYLEEACLGIADYFLQRPEWHCTRLLPVPEDFARLPHLNADGVISRVELSNLNLLKKLKIPVVDIANWMPDQHFPRVLVDDAAVGKMAAEHLLDLGLRHYGIIGPTHAAFHHIRHKHFHERLAKEGFELHAPKIKYKQLPSDAQMPLELDKNIGQWLKKLPKPVGILATTDHVAAFVLEICHQVSLRVPEDVCVIGVDNDQLVAGFARPPLSSVALPSRKIGFEAVRLLESMMNSKTLSAEDVILPPNGVITRQSTDLLMVPDQDVQRAVRYIRERIHDKITVSDILQEVPINRRYLERKFMKWLGRTPLQEIRRVRIEVVKDLLQSTDLSMAIVARRSGFANPQRLAEVFRVITGKTPTEYRNVNRNDELIW